jgi:chorismate--pyruvate lyase
VLFVASNNGKNDDDASSSVGEQSVVHKDAKAQSSYDAVNDPPTYSATEREAMQPTSLVYERLSPAWRVLLLSDGSVTRHLSLLGKRGHTHHRASGKMRGEDAAAEVNEDDVTEEDSNSTNGENTKVEVIRMKPCSRDPSQPEDVVKIKGPLMQREVYLRYDAKRLSLEEEEEEYPLVYACSWWNANALDKFMKKREETMWSNLRKQNVELYREVRRVYLGKNARLAKAFGCKDLDEEIWARHYIFWSGGEPVTVVFEAFSPRIELV